jgi:hypothetical protein
VNFDRKIYRFHLCESFTGGNDNEELWNVLKICYNHLDKQHQNMFLDIVYFFGGLKISTIS